MAILHISQQTDGPGGCVFVMCGAGAHPDCLGRIAAYVLPKTSASLSVTPRCDTGDSPGPRMCIALVHCRIFLDKVLKRLKFLAQSRIAFSTALRSIPRIFLLES